MLFMQVVQTEEFKLQLMLEANWNLRTSGLPNLSVTKIATDPNNPATAYVTFSGYTASSKIYKTTNYGTNWTNISGNLPNIPTNCVVVNPANGNNIFVGTDLGVFSTTDGGSSLGTGC